MNVVQLNHVAIHGADLGASSAFYRGVPQIFLRDPDGHVLELTQIDDIS